LNGALVLAALFVAAGPQRPQRDTYLPENVRDVVQRAHEAEVDPKRGPRNAIELLKSERAKYANDERATSALDLRVAGTILREKFISSDEFPEPERYVQALSTYARLDLWEPGLKTWLDKTIAKNPESKKKLGKKSDQNLKVAILTRGSGLDKNEITRAFKKALEKVGMGFEVVAMADAQYALVLGAEDAPMENKTDTAVKISFGAERIENKKVVWKTTFFRVEAAKDPKVALASALEWTARIGGRDLYFRWLGERAFPMLADPKTQRGGMQFPGAHPDHDHDHTKP
jgi:hypothetical protein